MKKLIFRKFLKDTLKFFFIIALAIGLIVWVIQAVNYLDFVTEDGHSLYVYFAYSFFNFPKIIHRILPFVFFISLFYQISQYELKNELLIFWTNGINKIKFVNMVVIYSTVVMCFQIFLGAYLSPFSQNEARTFIRNSNIDFFPSLIKEGKFIDTVSNLTIFIESKDASGNYKNIFINDSLNGNKLNKATKSKLIYAKNGLLVNDGKNRYFELSDGKVITMDDGNITNFGFDKIDFNLQQYDSKTTTYPKIQEARSQNLFKCLRYHYNQKKEMAYKKYTELSVEIKEETPVLLKFGKYLTCEAPTIKNVEEEFLKRFYKPLYFPVLGLLSCLLIIISKENQNYNRFKLYLFSSSFFILVVSEISLRYSAINKIGILFFTLFPLLSFLMIYFFLKLKFNNKA